MSIRDHVAIITGAGRGVGKATARRFAREGARVVLFSRTPGPLDETTTDIAHEGGQVLSMAGDVSREEDVRALFQRAMDAYGRVDSLTEILAVEGKPFHIRVCAVSPGAVDTEMLRQAAPHLKAGMTPDDLAEILLFLAGDSGRMLSGSNIEIFSNA